MISVQRMSKKVNGRAVLENLSFDLAPGCIHGIIGPNGVGKTTLLQLLSGVMKPSSGEISLAGVNMPDYSRKALARRLAVLQQGGLPPAGFTVRQVVEMGRFPYQNWFGDEREDHSSLIDFALDSMGLTELSNRQLDQLSGGERQRVALAKVMVQEPEVILLDEPTTYLDIGYQVQLLDTVRQWQRERGLTIVAVLHDLNLASLYCDQILVLHQGGIAAMGSPAEVLNAALIRGVYQTEASIVNHPLTGTPQVLLQPKKQETVRLFEKVK